MKAIVYTNYGAPEVLSLQEVKKPTPKENEILIRIHATAVNSGDWRLRKADPYAVRLFFGLTKPRITILGGVLSGEIEAIGKNVKQYKVGDSVFGLTGMGFGAYAEYKCLPQHSILALKPNNISHTEATVIPFGGTTALYFIKKANIKRGQKVLIYGASGAVGTAAVQLAKYFGAQVTGVCSTVNLEMIQSLGADHVIDYTKVDFTKNKEIYDVIFETIDTLKIADYIKVLNPNGMLILSDASIKKTFQAIWVSITTPKKTLMGVINQKAEDMVFLKERIESGELKAVIDRTYSLEQMVEAHAYVEKGHKKGNVAISIIA